MPIPKPPTSSAAAEFGSRVRTRRTGMGLSQEKLAEKSELHWSYIGQVERGQVNPTLHNLLRIADTLGVDLGELTTGLTLD